MAALLEPLSDSFWSAGRAVEMKGAVMVQPHLTPVGERIVDGRIREWLLLLLRFAITRDGKDQAAALAMADEIDALGQRWRPSAPSFFRRTSGEVCEAIVARVDPTRDAILK